MSKVPPERRSALRHLLDLLESDHSSEFGAKIRYLKKVRYGILDMGFWIWDSGYGILDMGYRDNFGFNDFVYMGDFTELRVWQKAKDLAVYVYQITDKGGFVKDYGLRDQIRRAAVSIPSNIAEGEESCTNKQSIRFLYISKGSVAETLSQSIIALEIGYLEKEEFEKIKQECNSISKMLNRLIQSKSNSLEEPLPDYPEI